MRLLVWRERGFKLRGATFADAVWFVSPKGIVAPKGKLGYEAFSTWREAMDFALAVLHVPAGPRLVK